MSVCPQTPRALTHRCANWRPPVARRCSATWRAEPKPTARLRRLVGQLDGDHVRLHGRFSRIGQQVNRVVVDILRIKNGLLAEHWDVIGLPMFGNRSPG